MQDGDEGQELGQRSHRHRARDRPFAADPEHQPHRDEIGKRHLGRRRDAHVDAPRRKPESLRRRPVVFREFEFLGAERADHPDAGQVLVHDPPQDRHPVLEQVPQIAQLEPRRGRPPGDIGDEAEAEQSEDQVGREEQESAGGDEHHHLHRPQQPLVDQHPDPFEVQHAPGDQLAGMNPVVERKAQALEFLVEDQPEIVGEAVADRLPAIVVSEREEPAQYRHAQQQEGRVIERRARGVRARRAVLQQALRAVDRIAHQTRDRELKGARRERRQQRDRDPDAEAEGDPDDAPDDFGIAGAGIPAVHARIGAGIGAGPCFRRDFAVRIAAVQGATVWTHFRPERSRRAPWIGHPASRRLYRSVSNQYPNARGR